MLVLCRRWVSEHITGYAAFGITLWGCSGIPLWGNAGAFFWCGQLVETR